jgi:peptide/nickel transport system substrate-binding protein
MEMARKGRIDHPFESGPTADSLMAKYLAGGISRRQLLQVASAAGISLGLPGFLSAAQADDSGGTLSIGVLAPGAEIDPWILADNSSVAVACQIGEYLCLSYGQPELRPVLATSWSANDKSDVWTFKIRQGVKFSDGTSMTAHDVVATFEWLVDPDNGTNGLEALGGVLSKGGAKAIDDYTVQFDLDAPNGNFPWLASSDNASAMILPSSYKKGEFSKTWIGTGPFVMKSYLPNQRATFVRNPNYWGPKPALDQVVFVFYQDEVAMTLGLQSKDVQCIGNFSPTNGAALLQNPTDYKVNSVHSYTCSPILMRVDLDPLKDARVRRAFALTLDRDSLVKHLYAGYGQIGNDSPFAPVFASTDGTVPQRTRDLDQARTLLKAANYPMDYVLPIHVWDYDVNSKYAQVFQSSLQEVGVRTDLIVMNTEQFLGSDHFGSSPQLDSQVAMTASGSRGVPNIFLQSQLTSDGTRNTSHFRNSTYDSLYAQYVATSELSAQKEIAGKIQRLLLEETPGIWGFFEDYLTAALPNVSGVVQTAGGAIILNDARVA